MDNNKQPTIKQRRKTYAINLMLMMPWLIPFIPFVSLAMLLGFWRVNDFIYDTSGVAKVLNDMLMTMLIGIVFYTVSIGLLVWVVFF